MPKSRFTKEEIDYYKKRGLGSFLNPLTKEEKEKLDEIEREERLRRFEKSLEMIRKNRGSSLDQEIQSTTPDITPDQQVQTAALDQQNINLDEDELKKQILNQLINS